MNKNLFPLLLLVLSLLTLTGCADRTPFTEDSSLIRPESTDALDGASVWEALGEEYVAFALEFKASGIRRLIYMDGGKNGTRYEIENAVAIEEVYYALNEIEVGEAVSTSSSKEETLIFETTEGDSYSIPFKDSKLVVGRKTYSLSNDKNLWSLRSRLASAEL